MASRDEPEATAIGTPTAPAHDTFVNPLGKSYAYLAQGTNLVAVRNVAKYSDPVIPRAASERLDWEIIAELAGRVLVPRNNPSSLADPSMKLTLRALGFDVPFIRTWLLYLAFSEAAFAERTLGDHPPGLASVTRGFAI